MTVEQTQYYLIYTACHRLRVLSVLNVGLKVTADEMTYLPLFCDRVDARFEALNTLHGVDENHKTFHVKQENRPSE
jgi:hypothetical protein